VSWPVGVNRDHLGFFRRQVLAGSPLQKVGHVPGDVGLGGAGPGSLCGYAAGVLPQGEAERLAGHGSVHPRHRDPLIGTVVAQPDDGDVAGAAVDFPFRR